MLTTSFSGEQILAGLAALIAFWHLFSALDGLGYAVPLRPAVVVPARARSFARMQLVLIALGIGASLLSGPAHPVLYAAFLVPAVLAITEIVTSNVYGQALAITNADHETVHPVVVAAARHVFGEGYEKGNKIEFEDDDKTILQIDDYPEKNLVIISPLRKTKPLKLSALERALTRGLKKVKATGFNAESFWMAFVLPLGVSGLFTFIAYMLLNRGAELALRPTLGA